MIKVYFNKIDLGILPYWDYFNRQQYWYEDYMYTDSNDIYIISIYKDIDTNINTIYLVKYTNTDTNYITINIIESIDFLKLYDIFNCLIGDYSLSKKCKNWLMYNPLIGS